ncbi:Holliday junction ATP-dependent DNA helicase RuvB [Anaerohalosphaera lusitana]|uniref:Holliday junction ATP-dependent DNA helicase RuvB n=1 Tax=Anaerohalosphaera lusitana TaxID=1936003 RepID=A0A1U9NL87_9BACT|nr:Holliday junction DNA helicase RuvB C-terminal domain-containing protein [Anaerohalosphaera lusitana]AQT68703.1 Holliday junction ATP-dependent DNA helicase RuvB [Anaerohalosphaera lusitana]
MTANQPPKQKQKQPWPTLSDVSGRPGAVSALQQLSSIPDSRSPSSTGILICGPRGTGKKFCARAYHNSLGNHHLYLAAANSIETGDLYRFMLCRDHHDRSTLLIDNAEKLKEPLQLMLSTALSQAFIQSPNVPDARSYSLSVEPFTLILTATDEHNIIDRLKQNLCTSLQFDHYQANTLAEIINDYFHRNGLKLEHPQLTRQIADRSKNSASIAIDRIANTAVEKVRAEDRDLITAFDVAQTLRELKIDSLGLDETDRSLLKILELKESASISEIASSTRLDIEDLSERSEPFLLKTGLIKKTHGRLSITDKGCIHLKNTV